MPSFADDLPFSKVNLYFYESTLPLGSFDSTTVDVSPATRVSPTDSATVSTNLDSATVYLIVNETVTVSETSTVNLFDDQLSLKWTDSLTSVSDWTSSNYPLLPGVDNIFQLISESSTATPSLLTDTITVYREWDKRISSISIKNSNDTVTAFSDCRRNDQRNSKCGTYIIDRTSSETLTVSAFTLVGSTLDTVTVVVSGFDTSGTDSTTAVVIPMVPRNDTITVLVSSYDTSTALGWSGHQTFETFTVSVKVPRLFEYFANGGSGSMASETSTVGTTYSIKTNAFTRSGYTFNGWNTLADGSGTNYSASDNFTSANDLTLYAKWSAISSGGGGGGGGVSAPAPTKDQPTFSLTAAKTDLEFGQTIQLQPAGGVGSLGTTYSVSGTGLCQISSAGVLTALKEGTCVVTATKAGNSEYKSTTSNSITFTVKPLQAIENFGVSQPNQPSTSGSVALPATSKVELSITGKYTTLAVDLPDSYSRKTATIVRVTTVKGKKVYTTIGSKRLDSAGDLSFRTSSKFESGSQIQIRIAGKTVFTQKVE